MTQLGYNAGPRHARVWGLAKSFTKKLPLDTQVQRDRDCVALVSMVWSMIQANMPSEVVDPMEDALDAVEMPRLATRSVEDGKDSSDHQINCYSSWASRSWL